MAVRSATTTEWRRSPTGGDSGGRLGLDQPARWWPTTPRLKSYEAAGFHHLQVRMPPRRLLSADQLLATHAGALRESLRLTGLRLILHAPDDLRAGSREHDRQLDGALTYAALAGSDLLVYHGAQQSTPPADMRTRPSDEERSLRRLLPRAEELGVRIAIENLAPVYPWPELGCPDPAVVAELVRRLDCEQVGMCLDLGHAHIAAGLAGRRLTEVVEPLLARVILFHVHDNFGARADAARAGGIEPVRLDLHLAPGVGSVPWAALTSLLTPHPAPLQLEVHPSQAPGTRDAGDRDAGGNGTGRRAGVGLLRRVDLHRLALASCGGTSTPRIGHRAKDPPQPAPYLVIMRARPPQIVAFGGGGFSTEWGNTLLDDHVLGLTGVERPRVCFLPTASGDADHYVVRFYRAFPATRCEPSHISLFRRETGVGDPRGHLLAQDLVYVGGGSLVSLLGTWRAHGIDEALREAWQAGVVLCGGSAGSLCWFAHAVSGFHEGPARRIEGLGFLPWSNAVHYEQEPGRRNTFMDAIADGMPPGYGAGDAAALHFVGSELAEVVSSHAGAKAVYVSADGDRGAIERQLSVRYLGSPEAVLGDEAIAA